MTEFEDATIPIRAAQTPKVGTVAKPGREKRPGRKLLRFSVIAFLFAAILFIGWGTWHYVHSSPEVDDGESIADLDGFESTGEEVRKSARGPANPIDTSSGTDTMAMPDLPPEMFSKNEPATSADVWLTGTIEEAEQSNRIALPQRLSGGASDSSSLR